MTSLTLSAPAKLNLYLRLLGRRDDGLHRLESAVLPIDWCDTVQLALADELRLTQPTAGVDPESDLALRAARLLAQASGSSRGARIRVDKQIPIGAGLGGGSSDAASVLLGLNRLWQLDWPLPRLAELGARLGADVPLFLRGGPCWVEGIGERCQDLALAGALATTCYAVLFPGVAVDTGWAYGLPELVRDGCPLGRSGWQSRPVIENPFLAAACGRLPVLAQAHAWLAARLPWVSLSGSGSALFGPWPDDPGLAVELTGTLPEGWQLRRCRNHRSRP